MYLHYKYFYIQEQGIGIICITFPGGETQLNMSKYNLCFKSQIVETMDYFKSIFFANA